MAVSGRGKPCIKLCPTQKHSFKKRMQIYFKRSHLKSNSYENPRIFHLEYCSFETLLNIRNGTTTFSVCSQNASEPWEHYCRLLLVQLSMAQRWMFLLQLTHWFEFIFFWDYLRSTDLFYGSQKVWEQAWSLSISHTVGSLLPPWQQMLLGSPATSVIARSSSLDFASNTILSLYSAWEYLP